MDVRRVEMPEKQCFVVMPFAEHFSDHYHGIYVPAIQAAGLVPRRADSDPGPEPILDTICRGIDVAAVVLADLSEGNRNVMYEIGYAHDRDRPVILLAQRMEDVPSDIQHIRVLIYTQGKQGWREELSGSLTDVLTRVIAAPERYRLRAPVINDPGPHRIGEKVIIRERIGRFSESAAVRANAAAEAVARDTEAMDGPTAKRAFIRIRRAHPSQIRQLRALMKDHFSTDVGWNGTGEEYHLWWESDRTPDVAKVAEFAEILGMDVGLEGYSA